MELHIEFITAEDTTDLRHRVLRENKPISSCAMDGDNLESTMHIGAFLDSKCVGILSLFKASTRDIALNMQYQLRGMAVDPNYRNQNIGKALVHFAEDNLKTRKVSVLWCNARTSAVDFYKSLGYTIMTEEFHIPEVGPHFRMFKRLK